MADLSLRDPDSGRVIVAADMGEYNQLRYGSGYAPVEKNDEKKTSEKSEK